MKNATAGGRKSWCYWMEFLQEERRKISDPVPYPYGSPWELPEEKTDALLVQYDALAEEACESLVLDGVWPDMEPEVRYAVACRLDTVCELAADLYFAQGIRTRVVLRPPDLSITSMDQVWKFFLIDWWQRACPKPVSDYRDSLLQIKREKTVTFSIAEMRIKKAPVTVVLVKNSAVLTAYDGERTVQDFQQTFPGSIIVLCRQKTTGEYSFFGDKAVVESLMRRHKREMPWQNHTVRIR